MENKKQELTEVAAKIANAKAAKKAAEALIDKLQPYYFSLLDEVYGAGRVTFEHNGKVFGRIVAEVPKFDVERFREDHPDLSFLLKEKTTYSLDEEKADDYLEEHQEAAAILQSYMELKREARWKPPAEVKNEEA